MILRSPSGGRFNIAAFTKKIDIDNRISLRYYYRIADNILKQAEIFRGEKNVIDLYVMLLRFSSLVTETIPLHQEYRTSPQSNKLYLKRRLKTALSELEELKPAVQAKLEELQYKQIYQLNKQQNSRQSETLASSVEWPVKQNLNDYNRKQPVTNQYGYQAPNSLSFNRPATEHLQRASLSIPRPKEETLSKHSILGPNGLRGQWQRPTQYKVQYPSNLDFTPIQIPGVISTQNSIENGIVKKEEDGCSEHEKSSLEPVLLPKTDNHQIQESDSLISFEDESALISFEDENVSRSEVIRQPSPPPVLADVQDLSVASTATTETESGLINASDDALVCSEDPLQLHIPTELMNSFMKLAKSNTNKNLETCGILAGSLKNRKFYITALIIPKQESTSDSCQATNEEEIFEVQDKRSLFPLGWIHTHPTQSCFMSSIDVHTHYSYQIMLPEAVAIVMAPRDTSRTHGIFRLTSGGMTVIRHCPRRGFHSHDPTPDGSPIYRHCTDVYMNPSLKFDVIDLR